MAIFRPGPLVGAISGNLNDVAFRQTKSGPVIARRCTRTTSTTKAAYTARSRIRTAQGFWLELTDEQRNTWNNEAKKLTFSNRLGVKRHLNGHQLYIKNTLLQFKVFTTINRSPPVDGVHEPPSPMTLTFTAGAGPYTITIPPPPSIMTYCLVWGCRPMRNTLIAHWPRWTWLSRYQFWNGGINCKPDFDDALGAPAQDEAVAIRCRHWHSGYWPSSPVIASTIML